MREVAQCWLKAGKTPKTGEAGESGEVGEAGEAGAILYPDWLTKTLALALALEFESR